MHVGVWLDERKLGLLASCESLASRSVAIVGNLELSCIDGDDGADVEGGELDARAGHSLEEHPSVFQIVLIAVEKNKRVRLCSVYLLSQYALIHLPCRLNCLLGRTSASSF